MSAVCGSRRTTSTRQIISASTSAPIAAQAMAGVTKLLRDARAAPAAWTVCGTRTAAAGRGRHVMSLVPGDRRPVGSSPSHRLGGQSADIEGLSTTGVSCSLSSSRPIASHSAAASSAPGLAAGAGHGRRGHREFGRILRPRQPDFLAPGTAHGTAGGAESSRIDGIGRCAMGANDMHGAICTMTRRNATRRPLTNRKP